MERLAYVKGAVVGSAATESSPPAVDSRYPSGRNYHNIVKATREPETVEALSSKKDEEGDETSLLKDAPARDPTTGSSVFFEGGASAIRRLSQ